MADDLERVRTLVETLVDHVNIEMGGDHGAASAWGDEADAALDRLAAELDALRQVAEAVRSYVDPKTSVFGQAARYEAMVRALAQLDATKEPDNAGG